jgi:hypothetical protein
LWAGGDERGFSQEGIEGGFVAAPQLYEPDAEAMRIAADTRR